jgi:hypothetical protein
MIFFNGGRMTGGPSWSQAIRPHPSVLSIESQKAKKSSNKTKPFNPTILTHSAQDTPCPPLVLLPLRIQQQLPLLLLLLSVNALDVAKPPLLKNVPLASVWTIADVTVNEAPGSGTSSSARPSPQALVLVVLVVVVLWNIV